MEYKNFSFHMDAEIVFGRNTEAETGRLVKKYGGTKAMVVFGSGSVVKNGLLGRITDSLADAGIPCVEFGGVQPNPLRSHAQEGVRAALDFGADFILAAGGGSTIDTAKAIAFGLANGGDFWQFFSGKSFSGKAPEKASPVGAVITIAAAGSETSRSCVIVDDVDSGEKKGLWSGFRPRFAIMNPELTYTLPPYQTAAGCVDILAHTFMRYFSNYPSYLGDRFCEGTMRTIVKYAPVALREPENYEARAEILLAGSLSHCDLMFIGRPGDSSGGEHALESQVSAFYNTTHGAGLAVFMPAILKYFVSHGTPGQVARAALFAENVFDVSNPSGSDKETAEKGISRFLEWIEGLDMPTTLAGLGIPAEDIPEAVRRCMQARGSTIDGFMTLDEAAVKEIYESAAG